MKGKSWTIDENNFLKKNYSSEGAEFCAKALSRTKQAILNRAKKFKLKTNKRRYEDLSNQTFDKLTVISFVEMINRESRWKCQCECGNIITTRRSSLMKGSTTSCGCNQRNKLYKRCYLGGKYITGQEFGRIKAGAKYRDIKFEITIEDIENQFVKQNFKCAYTNQTLYFNQKDSKNRFIVSSATASVDRIDSTKNYTKDNIQIVHKDINIMKSDFSEEKFLNYIKQIYEYKIK